MVENVKDAPRLQISSRKPRAIKTGAFVRLPRLAILHLFPHRFLLRSQGCLTHLDRVPVL